MISAYKCTTFNIIKLPIILFVKCLILSLTFNNDKQHMGRSCHPMVIDGTGLVIFCGMDVCKHMWQKMYRFKNVIPSLHRYELLVKYDSIKNEEDFKCFYF